MNTKKTRTQIFLFVASILLWVGGLVAGLFLGFENERILGLKWSESEFSYQLAFGCWLLFFALGSLTFGIERVISILKRTK